LSRGPDARASLNLLQPILLLSLFSLAAIFGAVPLLSPARASTAASVMVTSQETGGSTITGYRTVLYASNGTILAEGFTPSDFTVQVGETYGVRAESYGACTFARWSDGVTQDPRTFTASGSGSAFVAVYSCGVSSSVSVGSINQNGSEITGFRTVLYASNGTIIAKGFTPNSFATTVGKSYGVRAESYSSCNFVEWSDGVTADPRTFTATDGPVSFVAEYYCGKVSPPPTVVQSCSASVLGAQTVACSFTSNVSKGDLLVVQLDDVVVNSFGDSLGNTFTLITQQDLESSTYTISIYYAIASSSGPDTFNVTGSGNYPVVIASELHGALPPSKNVYQLNTGMSATPTVAPYTPQAGSLNMAFVILKGLNESIAAGPGYKLVAPVVNSAADEYAVVDGSTSPSFTLGGSYEWTEVAIAFL
jgi:hypothetical protein